MMTNIFYFMCSQDVYRYYIIIIVFTDKIFIPYASHGARKPKIKYISFLNNFSAAHNIR